MVRQRRSSSPSPSPSPLRRSHHRARRSILPRTRFPLIILLILTTLLLYHYHYHSHTTLLSTTPSTAALFPYLSHQSIDWSSYAYSSYATSTAYLCNSLLLFEALQRYGSKADRILFYPDDWDLMVSNDRDRESQLLVLARDKYKVKLVPVDMNAGGLDEDEDDEDNRQGDEEVGNTNPGGGLGRDVIRFLVWDQTQYDRVIHLDSDITLQRHLDELFLLPKAGVAMPRAVWSLPAEIGTNSNNPKLRLSPRLMVLEPSREIYNELTAAARPDQKHPIANDELLYTSVFGNTALVLPHETYAFPISELRSSDHSSFSSSSSNPTSSPSSAAIIHFLDAPFPKPWIMWPRELLAQEMPICEGSPDSKAKEREEACRNRDHWFALYDDFRRRRKDVCMLLTEMAPKWEGGRGPGRKDGGDGMKGGSEG